MTVKNDFSVPYRSIFRETPGRVKNDFSVPYRSIFRETPGREIRSNQKIVLNRYFVLSHRRVSAKPPLAQTRVHRISSRTPLTERFEPPPRPTDGPPAVPKGPRSAGRSGLHRFRLNKVQPTSTLNQNWRELIFAPVGRGPCVTGGASLGGPIRPVPIPVWQRVGKLWTKTNCFSIHV